MATAFKLLCDRCGLSQREAASFLGVRPDTVKSWSAGRNNAPAGVIDQLRGLYAEIVTGASQAVDQIESLNVDQCEVGLASDDHEAKSLGLPCVGAHAAMMGEVIADLDIPVTVVPRGSTPITAKAADVHEG